MTDATQKRSYKDTLNLPKTAFPMKANLVQNEPASLKRWQQLGLYERLRETRKDREPFVFHDGPPYANGSIHLGHLLNKVLKDIIVRYKGMRGYNVPYIPGWDCHGLPIEHKVVQEIGPKAREMEPVAIRRKCKAYAEKFVKLQAQQMQRLLTLADYEHPYLTMNPQYEAGTLEVFAELVERGIVYRGLKPVHWSIENQTALAEAELEYYDREDTSIYVAFRVDPGSWAEKNLPVPTRTPISSDLRLVIWTTTPWTLPANLAVAVSPRAEYGLYNVRWRGDVVSLLIADELASKVLALGELAPPVPDEPVARFTGEQLLGLRYDHPFLDDGSNRRVVGADYVTLEDGTGLVHTAPGHGTEDYQTGLREGLDVYCPVRGDGTFDDTAPDWLRGKSVWDANTLVVDRLRESGHLFHAHQFTHSYPHDWRGKTPVIFRATEQWFINVDQDFSVRESTASLRARALAETAKDIAFFPEWGRNRMRGMLESRPDWCVSRQRSWGLPIPAFYGENEGEVLMTPASVRAVATLVREKGSDVWFLAPPEDLLQHYDADADPDAPAWAKDPQRRKQLKKSTDIFDVWFDSGTSWNSCIRSRFGDEAFPTDLYLEGSDQHRGWFQASLLPALGATGLPPFRALLTHGFMVDKEGKKMSKSLGNTLEVEELMKNYGADVCRWWVSSLGYENDIKVDESFFKLAGEEYRKVRNTIRFLLSNLYDFGTKPTLEGERYPFTADDATTIDGWVLGELDALIAACTAHYDAFQFRKVHELLFNFCNDTLSAVYLAAVKDRLYCDPADGARRRRTQTAMFFITDALIRLLAPLLPHTADEAWRALYGDAASGGEGAESVHLVEMPKPTGVVSYPHWREVMAERDRALKAIEAVRANQGIENPLEMGVRIRFSPKRELWFDKIAEADFADLCGVSRAEFVRGDDEANQATIEVLDLRPEPRCERSWKRDGTVEQRSDGGWLTKRDAEALGLA